MYFAFTAIMLLTFPAIASLAQRRSTMVASGKLRSKVEPIQERVEGIKTLECNINYEFNGLLLVVGEGP